MVPNVRAYDPAYAYELAVIISDGLERMVAKQEDCFYYITLYNENLVMPPMPAGIEAGIVRGMYPLRQAAPGPLPRVRLLGSGAMLAEVLRAADILGERFDVAADVWSVTSYQQLRADALAAERWNRLHPGEQERVPYVTDLLAAGEGPVIASSDWMKAVPDMISRWVPGDFTVLGTDGFGLSDTRTALRRHFEVDAEHTVAAALAALSRQGKVGVGIVQGAISDLGLDSDAADPANRP